MVLIHNIIYNENKPIVTATEGVIQDEMGLHEANFLPDGPMTIHLHRGLYMDGNHSLVVSSPTNVPMILSNKFVLVVWF